MSAHPGNLAVIEAFSAAVLAGDGEAAARLAHEDIAVEQAAGLPYGGSHRGLPAFYAMLLVMQQAWRELKIIPLGVIGDPAGNEFAIRARVEGLASDGTPMISEVLERWVLRDGKIAEIWPFYRDTAALAGQFGPQADGENER